MDFLANDNFYCPLCGAKLDTVITESRPKDAKLPVSQWKTGIELSFEECPACQVKWSITRNETIIHLNNRKA